MNVFKIVMIVLFIVNHCVCTKILPECEIDGYNCHLKEVGEDAYECDCIKIEEPPSPFHERHSQTLHNEL